MQCPMIKVLVWQTVKENRENVDNEPKLGFIHIKQRMPTSPPYVGTSYVVFLLGRPAQTTLKNVSLTRSAHGQTPAHPKTSALPCDTMPHSELVTHDPLGFRVPSPSPTKTAPTRSVLSVRSLAPTTAVAFPLP